MQALDCPAPQWRHSAGFPLRPVWAPEGQGMAPTPQQSLISTILRVGPSLLGCRSLCLLGQGCEQLLPHDAHPGVQECPCDYFLEILDLTCFLCSLKRVLSATSEHSRPSKPSSVAVASGFSCCRCGHWERSPTGGPPPPLSNRTSRRPGSVMDSSWARSLNRDM